MLKRIAELKSKEISIIELGNLVIDGYTENMIRENIIIMNDEGMLVNTCITDNIMGEYQVRFNNLSAYGYECLNGC